MSQHQDAIVHFIGKLIFAVTRHKRVEFYHPGLVRRLLILLLLMLHPFRNAGNDGYSSNAASQEEAKTKGRHREQILTVRNTKEEMRSGGWVLEARGGIRERLGLAGAWTRYVITQE